MVDAGERIEAATAALASLVVTRPRAIVLAFLVLTAVMAGGLGLVSTEEEATDEFTSDLPEQRALDAIEEEFEDPFEPSTETTQVIHVGGNVLARESLLRELRLLERVEARTDLRMAGASGPGVTVARQLDPSADTAEAQRRAVEAATPGEVRAAVRSLADEPGFTRSVATDFNPTSASASASITVISHDVPQGADTGVMTGIQRQIDAIASSGAGDLRIFGQGIIQDEFGAIIGDSLAIVMPIVVLLILGFLVVAYRDPIDLLLGLLALLMTIVWTFGFVGYAGIPFGQTMIAVPVLLLGVGVDFGIHVINRFREETVRGIEPTRAMEIAANQLMVAFVIVTVTAVFGFGANVTSSLAPIRNLGIVAAAGIIITFIIFGVFLPALKLEVDRVRARLRIPEFDSSPVASEGSSLGRLLTLPSRASRHAPALLVALIVLATLGATVYGAGVSTSFETEDFLPPEEQPGYLEYFPEAMQPGEYTVTSTINLLEDKFQTTQDQSVTLYVRGNFLEDHALASLVRPNDDPPDSLAVGPGGRASAQSIVTVIQSRAERDPAFGELVARNDRNGDGVPERNLERIYAELEAAPGGGGADRYLTDDRRAVRVEYAAEADAAQPEVAADARAFADEFRYPAVATGQLVVFDAVADVIFRTAIQSLTLAVVMTGIFLVISYAVLEGRPLLGLVNVFPIVISIAFLVATMRFLGMPLNALTATLLSISVGLGIAYSVHVTHRFIDEWTADDPLEVDGDGASGRGSGRGSAGTSSAERTSRALTTTMAGTGGALTGSMLTTALGTGALALAVTPVLGQFGVLMALSVLYAFITAVAALPPALYLWARLVDWRARRRSVG